MELLQFLDGEYDLHLERGSNCLAGEVWHVYRNQAGGSISTPVGFLVGRLKGATDERSPHWALDLFVRGDIVYDRELHVTRPLRVRRSTPFLRRLTTWIRQQRLAGRDRARLRSRRKVAFSNALLVEPPAQHLPPAFQVELVSALIKRSYCTEPVALATHAFLTESSMERGRIYFEDDDD